MQNLGMSQSGRLYFPALEGLLRKIPFLNWEGSAEKPIAAPIIPPTIQALVFLSPPSLDTCAIYIYIYIYI